MKPIPASKSLTITLKCFFKALTLKTLLNHLYASWSAIAVNSKHDL